MKTSICSIALATLTAACVLAVSVADAQGRPTAAEWHARAFEMAGPRLELRNDGLVYKKGAKQPYTGIIEKDKTEEMRYVDGVLENITSDRRSGQVRAKEIYIDGLRIIREVRIGDNNAPLSDQILIDRAPFENLIRVKNDNLFVLDLPDTTALRIDDSGLVSAHWYADGQMSSSLRYVKGKCCLATAWHQNGQKSYEQKYVDGIGEGTPQVWDADGNDVLKMADPVVFRDWIRNRDELDYLGYSAEPFTGKVVSTLNPEIEIARSEYSVANGKKHGSETKWNGIGQITLRDEWSDGVQLSHVIWYGDGGKRQEIIYAAHPEFIDKLATTDRSDPVLAREQLASRVKGYESHITEWHRNGQMNGERTFIKTGGSKRALHGLSTGWYDSGQKYREAIYQHGLVKSKTIWRDDGRKRCEVFRDAITQPLQYKAWDEEGNEVEPMTFADASHETHSKSGYLYACSVHKQQLGYKVEFVL